MDTPGKNILDLPMFTWGGTLNFNTIMETKHPVSIKKIGRKVTLGQKNTLKWDGIKANLMLAIDKLKI
uniref:Uncharacterized protein n=1 Tax=Romanomermis culicivorax TaxID=13658 RepID=A0A915J3W2_ROMCU